MIARTWSGATRIADTDAYQQYAREDATLPHQAPRATRARIDAATALRR
jgi:hypothetical protein